MKCFRLNTEFRADNKEANSLLRRNVLFHVNQFQHHTMQELARTDKHATGLYSYTLHSHW